MQLVPERRGGRGEEGRLERQDLCSGRDHLGHHLLVLPAARRRGLAGALFTQEPVVAVGVDADLHGRSDGRGGA
ncbi:MAG: hypothetical protein AVDCRST_MAG79-1809 [uncultured Thermoleophilia bacterium]|uniref:Uncharacterized protein n=1 Tax=uncultured Thermoleophilia bacterium TaxID=1497501 RepID=A0A6J4U755_9ACTN|nr:MAG: hypothetical protein AVDCRST_MAG79-1809 [uncultured Thermoleophilia bacterium]